MPSVPLKIAVAAAAFSRDIRESIVQSRMAGFSGLLFDTPGSGGQLLDLSSTGQREVRRILARENQSLVGLSAKLPGKGFRPDADIEQGLRHVERLLIAARGLGAEVVCVDLGPLPPPPADPQPPKPKITPEQAGLIIIPDLADQQPDPAPPPAAPDPSFVAAGTDALRELGVRADRYSVTVAFRSGLAGFAALTHALQSVDCPWFGVDLDPVAVLSDEWTIDEIFARLGPLIRHVRGRDAVRGDNHRTQPAVVGQGDTDWTALLAALDDAAYNGWISIDPVDLPDRPSAAMAGLRYLPAQRR